MENFDEESLSEALDRLALEAGPSPSFSRTVRAGRRTQLGRRLSAAGGLAGVIVAAIVAVAMTDRGGSTPSSEAAVPAAGDIVAAPQGLPVAVSGGRLTVAADSIGGNLATARIPSASLIPKVSAAMAYASCLTDPNAHCATNKGPTMVFALVATDAGGHVNADGSVNRVLNGSPTWILTWSGLTCTQVSGGAPVVPSPTAAAAAAVPSSLNYACTRTSLIDATTGKWISTIDSSS